MMVWGLRLSAFLFFRVLKSGKDDRFDDIRQHFIKFLGFWTLQFLWVWLGSLPIVVLNSPNIQRNAQPKFGTGRDIAGVILFAIALTIESIADIHKYRFRVAHPEKKEFVSTGLYAYSRHPNYFGEILAQFGKALLMLD
jgi:steroid 5-alpha reductase family enzyme